MTDQIYLNKPSNQLDQTNNMLWIILVGFVALILVLFVVFNSRNDSSNEVLQTPVPQNPQETQVPQNPQETQVPQNPQETQVPQNPQSTQIPQSTTIPTPTVKL